jgi:hypothetical protein
MAGRMKQPVATGGKWDPLESGSNRPIRNRWQPTATVSEHGRQGVDGSSPSEGSAKAPHVGGFSFGATCSPANVRWVLSRAWSSRVQNGVARKHAWPTEKLTRGGMKSINRIEPAAVSKSVSNSKRAASANRATASSH